MNRDKLLAFSMLCFGIATAVLGGLAGRLPVSNPLRVQIVLYMVAALLMAAAAVLYWGGEGDV